MNIPETAFMKVERLILNEKEVYVFDAPENATHGRIEFKYGVNYNVCRKSKVMHAFVFDKNIPDHILTEKYDGRLLNIGMLKVADESLVAGLFTPVKHGNFYDYEHNGVYYPTAIGALRDIIDQDFGFKNPFVLAIM